ncbi:peptidylprolyl isomerase [Paenibacillus apiarius]|uniref:Peptidyl-prolyl cis-trans isomerase n=1 Tax=Paenibacillus apiarius TaxID=46240 RepID=A0ABT4DQK5_9BACL|nr:peptidylprolyl isomerase [Paenibacillus apiarius]MBN3526883.1 peptidylprolyl isomerase [Paenibacillus apiarius]MCY9513390.1 peptidylprolyl isomerase [Paenibacillus apiarius]MCY9519638.1 peptidylprolyl isomerase [Paenibacillus apiarius]MCY9553306.1 peptidylprolyl isomerase [Paenibacillus apiarius]MCY9557156.1 peptidylprolyl isomerase [Paenibacillus apiarius]
MRSKKIRSLSILLLAVMIIIAGCGAKSNADNAQSAKDNSNVSDAKKKEPAADGKNPLVTIEMENGKKIELELYPDIAPNTVNNFISLVNKGFYDGLIFHRVIPGFMIQGGDPEGTGIGGPGYSIKGEFADNNFQNDLKHSEGVISMARSASPDSAGSQFFIMVAEASHLDGQYAAFGKVTKGMETVQEIVGTPRNAQDMPDSPQKMKKVTVDTLGVEYKEPEIIKQ